MGDSSQATGLGFLCLAVVESLLLSGSEDTTIRIWRREEAGWSHECLAVLDSHRGPVRCLAGTLETMENRVMNKMETSVLVYSGSLDQTFKVWGVKMKKLYETSPVLSPSWVQKKLQPNYF
ncbi:F-box/WD repeat-containing protein sel-10-like [Cucumis melo var. makuwa]|uniref:F-box/WD repeat-containing protein sel-10-like n=1 Tax=Cucumis melo var. makuwa TaxID=1194695 RepID=A0A5A7TAM5_CUCMM|nr:F-box/WD repeat-containing protein sel-10-like [Cucumis melo var. makuwa]TYK31216.1 F-box/WD repeat-containing protein sel-10-like [Cucumis melo var. makuwa]